MKREQLPQISVLKDEKGFPGRAQEEIGPRPVKNTVIKGPEEQRSQACSGSSQELSLVAPLLLLLSRFSRVRPHRRQPTRLPHPWDSPGQNTGVGCHFLLQCRKVKSENEVTQSCPILRDPTDCSPPGSSVHGIFQARVLEWGAISFSTVMGRGLEICISNNFQAKLMLASPRTMLGESLLQSF